MVNRTDSPKIKLCRTVNDDFARAMYKTKQKRNLVFSRIISIILLVMITVLLASCKSIQQAAREGDIEHIKKLLALGVNINSRTYFGDQGSALHRASTAGQ